MRADSTACEMFQVMTHSISECKDCNPEELTSPSCRACYLTQMGIMREGIVQVSKQRPSTRFPLDCKILLNTKSVMRWLSLNNKGEIPLKT